MIDGLPSVRARVHDDSVARLSQSFLSRDVRDHPHQAAQINRVIRMLQRLDMLFRNDQNVRRRFWTDVAKRYCVIILHHDVRGNLSIRDPAKQTVG
jgi:hypothetical protein